MDIFLFVPGVLTKWKLKSFLEVPDMESWTIEA